MKISHITSPEKEKKNRHLTLPLVQVLMETNELGQILATYTRGNRLISRSSQVVTYFYYFDALGSIRQIADTTGRLQGFTYCAFGTLIEQTETGSTAGNPTPDTSTGKAEVGLIIFLSLGLGILILKNRKGALILFLSIFLTTIPGHPQAAIQANNAPPNPYGFTGERQFNEPDGLIFLRARYYDPSIGRFISRDPILLPMMGGGGSFWVLPYLVHLPDYLHPYAYVANNPVNWVDPTGLKREKIDKECFALCMARCMLELGEHNLVCFLCAKKTLARESYLSNWLRNSCSSPYLCWALCDRV